MHDDDERGDGFLAGADYAPQPNGDPLAAVRAVAEPRAEAGSETRRNEDPIAAGGNNDSNTAAGESGEPGENGYGDFAWPDGYVADPKAMARFVPLARKLGLPRESAQQLAGLYAELDQEKQRSQAEFIARNNAEWLKEIHSHPEFGGHNLQHAADGVAATMRRFGTPLLMAQVRQMNIQNWPEMFFFLARVSQAVAEDCSPSGSGADAPAKSTAQLLFPGLK